MEMKLFYAGRSVAFVYRWASPGTALATILTGSKPLMLFALVSTATACTASALRDKVEALRVDLSVKPKPLRPSG